MSIPALRIIGIAGAVAFLLFFAAFFWPLLLSTVATILIGKRAKLGDWESIGAVILVVAVGTVGNAWWLGQLGLSA